MSNLWTEFIKLIPSDTTQVATVISTDGTYSNVQLLSGDTHKVLGTATVGFTVYIKGGEIKSVGGTLTAANYTLF